MSIIEEKIEFINKFNKFISDIHNKKEQISINIDILNKILKSYNSYIYIITLTNNDFILYKILSKDAEYSQIYYDIYTNIIKISEIYNYFYDSKIVSDIHKKQDDFIDVILLYNNCLINALIAFYEYYIINEIISRDDYNIPSGRVDLDLLINFFSKFKAINNDIITRNDNIKEMISKVNSGGYYKNNVYKIIYKISVLRFNQLFFSTNSYYPIKIHKISETQSFLANLNSFRGENDISNSISELLLQGTLLYKENYESNIIKDKYIAIPYYSDYSWFVNFLTGLTYSDKNKALLLNKMGTLDRRLFIPIHQITGSTNSNKIFISLIDYIINNITNVHKKYSDDLSSDCTILKNLKNIPPLFLNKLQQEIKEEEKSILSSDQALKRPGKRKIDELLLDSMKSKIVSNSADPLNYFYRSIMNSCNSLALSNSDSIIIKKFYKFLNINSLFIYEIDKEKFAIDRDLEKEGTYYDIILISTQKNFCIISDTDNYINISDEILKIDDKKLNIKFKKCQYELDYIMINVDDKSYSGEKEFHSICGLHYKGKECYYDSQYLIKKIECRSSDEIELTRSLIEKNWTTRLNEEENALCTFTCAKINNYIPSDILDVQVEPITSFNNTNMIYCYVKKDPRETLGGKNNKKIIRKVYLDKKLNKYYVNYNNNKIYLSK